MIWPSCSKRSSARPGVRAMTRAPGAASTSIATVLSGIDSAEIEPRCRRDADALARPAERFEHRQPRGAETDVGEKRRQRRRSFAVGGQRQDARAGLQMRPHQIEGAAMDREQRGLRQATSRAAPPPG